MQVLNCASTGAMGSILRKLNELLLRADEDEAQTIRQLRDGVATIGTKLAELSEVHDPPLTVTHWMGAGRPRVVLRHSGLRRPVRRGVGRRGLGIIQDSCGGGDGTLPQVQA